MRKFNDVFKEKLQEAENRQEAKVIGDFKEIYSTLLEHNNLVSIHDLTDDGSKVAFLAELNAYWSEEDGITPKGENFLKNRSMMLTEKSTDKQKKNYLKSKATVLIAETLRQTGLKYTLYDVVEEMYKQVNAAGLKEILKPAEIVSTIKESFDEVLKDFIGNIDFELTESYKEQNPSKVKYVIKLNEKKR